jgi:Lrp/AsnC family leucine-responsive transcriptional regulator
MELEMDKFDRKILNELHQNARITNPVLAEKIGLSTSPCWSRVRRMEKDGVIQQYVTIINQEKIGLPDTAIIEVMFERHDAAIFSEFEETVGRMPEVIEAYLLTGGYEDFLVNKLYKFRAIKNTRSSLTLRCFKQAYTAAP